MADRRTCNVARAVAKVGWKSWIEKIAYGGLHNDVDFDQDGAARGVHGESVEASVLGTDYQDLEGVEVAGVGVA